MMYYFALPMCIFVLLSFCQSDESDGSSEEETATDNGEDSLSDGKKSMQYIVVLQMQKGSRLPI